MRGEVVADDRDVNLGRVEAAQVAAELQELVRLLTGLMWPYDPQQPPALVIVDLAYPHPLRHRSAA
jgi:hypothetical protein